MISSEHPIMIDPNRHVLLKERFGPILGSNRVDSSDQIGFWYVTPYPRRGQTLLFPHGHSLALQPRYEWRDQGEGISYGYLVPEAKASDAS
jgi:hypothetical protein